MPHTKVVTVSLTKKSIKITAEKNMNTKLIEKKHPEFIVSIYCHSSSNHIIVMISDPVY